MNVSKHKIYSSYTTALFAYQPMNCNVRCIRCSKLSLYTRWVTFFFLFFLSTHDHHRVALSKLFQADGAVGQERYIFYSFFPRVVYSQVSISHKANMKHLHCPVDGRGCSLWYFSPSNGKDWAICEFQYRKQRFIDDLNSTYIYLGCSIKLRELFELERFHIFQIVKHQVN